MTHLKIDSDTTEKRGRTRFASVLKTAKMLKGTIRNEVKLRNAQSSIILVRKVQGGSGSARLLLDNTKTSTTNYPEGDIKREKWRPGTILTTTSGVEVDFKQPTNNFSDASPLIQVLIQQLAAATGFSYEQLSMDTSNGTMASALVSESPTYQMIEAEREAAQEGLEPLFWAVVGDAIKANKLEGSVEDFQEKYRFVCKFGQIMSRDHLKVAQAFNLAVMHKAAAVSDFTEAMGLEPDATRKKVEDEQASGLYINDLANQIPGSADTAASSAANATAGGTNQGNEPEGAHKDANEQAKEIAKYLIPYLTS